MNLIIIRGPGGSGKSTVANLIAEKLRGKIKAAVIESDDFYWGFSGEEHDDDVVFEGIRRLESLYLERGYDVIIVGQLTSMDNGKLRSQALIEEGKLAGANIRRFFLEISLEESVRRISEKFKKEGWKFNEVETVEWYERVQERRIEEEIEIDAEEKSPDVLAEELLSRL